MAISSLNSPKQWRKRAEEMRAVAEYSRSPEARATILRIAENYDFLAGDAAARLKGRYGPFLRE